MPTGSSVMRAGRSTSESRSGRSSPRTARTDTNGLPSGAAPSGAVGVLQSEQARIRRQLLEVLLRPGDQSALLQVHHAADSLELGSDRAVRLAYHLVHPERLALAPDETTSHLDLVAGDQL